MKSPQTPIRRRLAQCLTAHAGRMMPAHRADWARAMRHEVELLPDDDAALRWALGAVLASYREASARPGLAISAGLVLTSFLIVVMSFSLLQTLMVTQWAESILFLFVDPAQLTPSDFLWDKLWPLQRAIAGTGTFTLMLGVAFLVVSALVRWIPSRTRRVVAYTISLCALLYACAILIYPIVLPDAAFSLASTAVLLLALLSQVVPLTIALRAYQRRLVTLSG